MADTVLKKDTFLIKVVLVLLAAVISLGALSACGSDDSEDSAPASDYVVKIGKCKVSKDYEGKKCLIVNYTFINNSDEKTSAAVACNFEAYQNDSELELAIGADYDSGGYMSNVKKGGKKKFQLAYELEGSKDVEIEVTELISFSDDVLAHKTVSVK